MYKFFYGLVILCFFVNAWAEGCGFENYTRARVEIARDNHIYSADGKKVLTCTGSCNRGHVIVVPASFRRGTSTSSPFGTEKVFWCKTGKDGAGRGSTWAERVVSPCRYSEYMPFQNSDSTSWKNTTKYILRYKYDSIGEGAYACTDSDCTICAYEADKLACAKSKEATLNQNLTCVCNDSKKHWVNNKCVCKKTYVNQTTCECPSGQHEEGNACVPDKSPAQIECEGLQAQKKGEWKNNTCLKVGKACTDAAHASAGTYIWNNGVVCAATACQSGYYLVMKNGRSQGWCTAVTCGANQHVNEVESGKVDINNKCVDNPPPASEPGNDEPAPAASPASPTDPSSPAGPDTPGASANPTAPEDPETPENPNASGITPDGREPAGGTGNTGGEDADVPADTPPAGNTEPDTPPAASVVPESSEEVARRKQEEEKAESQAKIDALQEKADEAKKREQSTANKLLGGAAIGATGIGMQNLLEGKAEQSADEDAERAMKAYLETFTCDYGQGRNIKGGQMEIELPGATQLFEQVNEYKVLAADLKARKEALGLRAGIESEVILDKAETGLYDDAGVGITGGAYTSLSRALQDPTGKDAADLAQQKSDASSKVKTGAITAGAGAIGGAVGNLIINRDKDDANKKDDK